MTELSECRGRAMANVRGGTVAEGGGGRREGSGGREDRGEVVEERTHGLRLFIFFLSEIASSLDDLVQG